MAGEIMWINGESLETLGLRIPLGGVGPWWSTPPIGWRSISLQGRLGGLLAPTANSQPKVLRCRFVMAEDITTRREALDVLYNKLTGELEIELEHEADRIYRAVWEGAEGRGRFPELTTVRGDLAIDMTFIIPSGLSEDEDEGTGSVTSSPLAVPGGTARSGLILTIDGALSSAFTVTMKDYSGATVGTPLSIANPVLGSGDKLIIDGEREMLFFDDGATVEPVPELYISGDFPAIAPEHQDYSAEDWMTIEASVNASLRYRRRWL